MGDAAAPGRWQRLLRAAHSILYEGGSAWDDFVVANVLPSGPWKWSLITATMFSAVGRLLRLYLVRSLFRAAERYWPDTLQHYLRATPLQVSPLLRHFDSVASMALSALSDHVFPVLLALTVRPLTDQLRYHLIDRRYSEMESLRQLLPFEPSAAVTALMRILVIPGEETNETSMLAARREIPSDQVRDVVCLLPMLQCMPRVVYAFVCIYQRNVGASTICISDTLDPLILFVSSSLGARLGSYLRRSMGYNLGPSGTVYNMARLSGFACHLLWVVVREHLPRWFPGNRLFQPMIPIELPLDLVHADLWGATFLPSMGPAELQLLKDNLNKIIAGQHVPTLQTNNNPPRPLRRREAEQMLPWIDRHERRMKIRREELRDAWRAGVAGERAQDVGSPCPICMENLEQATPVLRLTRCNHPFHPTCIEKWLIRPSSRAACPLCQLPVPQTRKPPWQQRVVYFFLNYAHWILQMDTCGPDPGFFTALRRALWQRATGRGWPAPVPAAVR